LNLGELSTVQRYAKHFNDYDGRQLHTAPEKFQNGENVPIHTSLDKFKKAAITGGRNF